jgi:hypothetical protein
MEKNLETSVNEALGSAATKMSGNDSENGMMTKKQAEKFVMSLNFEPTIAANPYNKHVRLLTSKKGLLKLNGLPDFDPEAEHQVKRYAAAKTKVKDSNGNEHIVSDPSAIIQNMLMAALTKGKYVDKWSLYIPDVNQKLGRNEHLSPSAIKNALECIAKAGPIEAKLVNNKVGWSSPSVWIANKGTGNTNAIDVNADEDVVFE